MSKNRQKKNRKRTVTEDPEAELRKGLREHNRLERERTSVGLEYGGEEEEEKDGQK